MVHIFTLPTSLNLTPCLDLLGFGGFTTRLSFGLLRFFVCCSGVKRYFFNNGYHVQAIVAMVLAIIPSIPGYIESVILNGEDDTAWYTPGPTHPRIATPPPKRPFPRPSLFLG